MHSTLTWLSKEEVKKLDVFQNSAPHCTIAYPTMKETQAHACSPVKRNWAFKAKAVFDQGHWKAFSLEFR